MTVTELRRAVTAVIRGADSKAKVIHGDVPEPVPRGAYKIDVLPTEVGAACAGARERQTDVDIWYYSRNKERPRDECDEVAERLVDAFAEGFSAGDTWLMPDEDVSLDISQGVLVMQFGISWSESARETGEPMETLIYDREELTT